MLGNTGFRSIPAIDKKPTTTIAPKAATEPKQQARQEETTEYGLRTRGKDGKSKKSSSSSSTSSTSSNSGGGGSGGVSDGYAADSNGSSGPRGNKQIFKGWSVPKLPESSSGSFKRLAKSQAKSDLRLMRETLEDDILEDQSFHTMGSESYANSRLRKAPFSGRTGKNTTPPIINPCETSKTSTMFSF